MGIAGDADVGAAVTLMVLCWPIGLLKRGHDIDIRGHDIDIKPGAPLTAYVDQAADVSAQP